MPEYPDGTSCRFTFKVDKMETCFPFPSLLHCVNTLFSSRPSLPCSLPTVTNGEIKSSAAGSIFFRRRLGGEVTAAETKISPRIWSGLRERATLMKDVVW